jgi:hypothetical protein
MAIKQITPTQAHDVGDGVSYAALAAKAGVKA